MVLWIPLLVSNSHKNISREKMKKPMVKMLAGHQGKEDIKPSLLVTLIIDLLHKISPRWNRQCGFQEFNPTIINKIPSIHFYCSCRISSITQRPKILLLPKLAQNAKCNYKSRSSANFMLVNKWFHAPLQSVFIKLGSKSNSYHLWTS